jgi:methyl-accepting chemotaxis protein
MEKQEQLMDFDQAILAHTGWKNRFRSHLKGKEVLAAETVAADDKCELGQWLHGNGKKYAGQPEFQVAMRKHARFHAVAAEVIQKAKTMPAEQRASLIALGSEYGKASTDCVASIVALRDAFQDWK